MTRGAIDYRFNPSANAGDFAFKIITNEMTDICLNCTAKKCKGDCKRYQAEAKRIREVRQK